MLAPPARAGLSYPSTRTMRTRAVQHVGWHEGKMVAVKIVNSSMGTGHTNMDTGVSFIHRKRPNECLAPWLDRVW